MAPINALDQGTRLPSLNISRSDEGELSSFDLGMNDLDGSGGGAQTHVEEPQMYEGSQIDEGGGIERTSRNLGTDLRGLSR